MAKPLVDAGRLRQQGRFDEAEALLKTMLQKNPEDIGAAMSLMRLYAEDLRQPGRAHEVLRALGQQRHVSADHLEFARRSIDDWARAKPAGPSPAAGNGPPPKAESIDDLLAQGGIGTVIELLEAQIKAQPGDFGLQLRLAEVYAVNCKNLSRAGKIIQQMERTAYFNPEQIALAGAKLREWQATATHPHG